MRNLFTRLWKEESGATMVEYSLLIGLVTVGAVTTIALVGPWVSTQWTTLWGAINP